jgi:hypothetical protein
LPRPTALMAFRRSAFVLIGITAVGHCGARGGGLPPSSRRQVRLVERAELLGDAGVDQAADHVLVDGQAVQLQQERRRGDHRTGGDGGLGLHGVRGYRGAGGGEARQRGADAFRQRLVHVGWDPEGLGVGLLDDECALYCLEGSGAVGLGDLKEGVGVAGPVHDADFADRPVDDLAARGVGLAEDDARVFDADGEALEDLGLDFLDGPVVDDVRGDVVLAIFGLRQAYADADGFLAVVLFADVADLGPFGHGPVQPVSVEALLVAVEVARGGGPVDHERAVFLLLGFGDRRPRVRDVRHLAAPSVSARSFTTGRIPAGRCSDSAGARAASGSRPATPRRSCAGRLPGWPHRWGRRRVRYSTASG